MDNGTYKITIKGLVQGVGFRPFVYRIALYHNIKGSVENRNDGVKIIARGNRPVVRLEVLPEARSNRKIGHAKGLILSVAADFDEPLDDFREYME